MVLPVLSIEVLEELLTAAGALIVPVLGKFLGLQPFIDALGSFKKKKPPSATAGLIARLQASSAEMDLVISELRAAADERLRTVTTLETSINALTEKQKSLNEKIEGTEGLSRATVDRVAEIVEEKLKNAERPAKKRDYALFAAGVIVSALVGIGVEATKPYWEKALHLKAEHAQTTAITPAVEPRNVPAK